MADNAAAELAEDISVDASDRLWVPPMDDIPAAESDGTAAAQLDDIPAVSLVDNRRGASGRSPAGSAGWGQQALPFRQ